MFLHGEGIASITNTVQMQECKNAKKKVYSAKARHPPPPYKKQTPWHGRKIFLAMQKTGR